MSHGLNPIETIISRTEIYREILKIHLITVLNATQSLRFCSANNEKHSTSYIKINRHLIKTIAQNTGFDRFPDLFNIANDALKNFL